MILIFDSKTLKESWYFSPTHRQPLDLSTCIVVCLDWPDTRSIGSTLRSAVGKDFGLSRSSMLMRAGATDACTGNHPGRQRLRVGRRRQALLGAFKA